MLYIAVGILGATVMPHNLYLHSSIIQTRKYGDSIRQPAAGGPLRDHRLDGRADVRAVPQRRDPGDGGGDLPRHRATRASPTSRTRTCCSRRCSARSSRATLFALALLFSGQNSTLTGTLAGQIVMEGFLNIRLRPWLRRLITRLIAIVPALVTVCDLRRARQRRAAHPEPGGSEPAAAVRGVPAGALHRRPPQDGRPGRAAVDGGAGLAGRGADCRPQRLAALADLRCEPPCTATSSSPSSTPPPTRAVLTHIEQLATLTPRPAAAGARGRRLGGAALPGSEAARIGGDQATTAPTSRQLCQHMTERGLETRGRLALGDPATELVKVARKSRST